MTPAERYVNELGSSLPRLIPRRRRILIEIREHLRADARDEQERGLDAATAQARAVDRLGPADELAARFASNQRRRALASTGRALSAALTFWYLNFLVVWLVAGEEHRWAYQPPLWRPLFRPNWGFWPDLQAAVFAALGVALLAAAIADRRIRRLIAAVSAAAPAIYLAVQFSYAGAPFESVAVAHGECLIGLIGALALTVTRPHRDPLSRSWVAQAAFTVATIPLLAVAVVWLLEGAMSKPRNIWVVTVSGSQWLIVLTACSACLYVGRALLSQTRAGSAEAARTQT